MTADRANKVDLYIMANAKYFPPEKVYLLKDKLLTMDDNKFTYLLSVQMKDPGNMLVISILVGEFGVDRFMLGDTALGILKLVTFGGCLIWWLIDLFSVQQRTRERNFNEVVGIIS